MAQEQAPVQTKTPWTKIFTAFKVALDVKKLVLAAAGIFCMALGWWLIGVIFHGLSSMPVWKDYEKTYEDPKASFRYFKAKRNSWNLLHELAGSPSDTSAKIDAADVTDDYATFDLLRQWEDAYRIEVTVRDKTLQVGTAKYTITPLDKQAEEPFAKLSTRKLTIHSLKNPIALEKGGTLEIDEVRVNVVDGDSSALVEAIKKGNVERQGRDIPATYVIFQKFLEKPAAKPSGKLRTMPWFEDRGPNPYLLVSDLIESPRGFAAARPKFIDWLLTDQAPVVLEPLFKFFQPIAYFFDPRAGWMDRVYLVLILLWTLAVWGFFGGAISRIAAVQVARNERISLAEAIKFTSDRCTSYLAAPVFPLVLVAIFMVLLIIFGWLEWTPYAGDVFAGLLWPVVLLLGFIMAIVLVGLVGWPLMVATISVEGNDSFDALSRSYSYVYQAPWQYLWYNFLAVVYGAVLVFFVGFMASMMVFLGKWGVASAPGLARNDAKVDREPSYLFYYAPTSFGWRDLMISGNQHTVKKIESLPSGRVVQRIEFNTEYLNAMTAGESMGAWLVAVWIYPFFLLVVGFGYSFFWSASTIIYFLMRHQVDDTDLDEVHMEDEDLEDPFMKPAPTAPAPAVPATKPGVVSLNVVEPPPPVAPPSSAIRADEPPAASPAPPEPPATPSTDGTPPA